jgi:PAS domain S-box-containing protein
MVAVAREPRRAPTLAELGADMEQALTAVNIPSYVIDRSGVIRWLNPAAEHYVGDVRGRQFTSVCAPEETRRAREIFARKLAGTARVTDAEAALLDAEGDRILVELSSVPLMNGHRCIGVFGQIVQVEEQEDVVAHPHLTPRQSEILRLLERGHSTAQMARELHLSVETVRNHVAALLRALGVHSRVEAVAYGRRPLATH